VGLFGYFWKEMAVHGPLLFFVLVLVCVCEFVIWLCWCWFVYVSL